MPVHIETAKIRDKAVQETEESFEKDMDELKDAHEQEMVRMRQHMGSQLDDNEVM